MEYIIQMEEKIKIIYLGQELSLSLSQIINLQPLVKHEHIKKLKLPTNFIKFKVNYQVLHSCLYYLVSIEKGIYSLTTTDFRQKCLTAMQSYYINHKMNFQLYEYGYLCSKILSYSLERSLHIIYFLIYTKLASKPYILNVIGQADKARRLCKKQTYRSQVEQSAALSNERDSRHMTVFMENGQIQFQSFKKDLRKIFNSQADLRKTVKRSQNKRLFNLRKLYPDQEFEYKAQQSVDQLSLKNMSTGRSMNIPLKVGAYDNSSVIDSWKHHSRNKNTAESLNLHKNMVRRQKFKEEFNACEQFQTFKKQGKQQRKQWQTPKTLGDDKVRLTSNIYRIQKHNYQYFREVTHGIKYSNRQLDLIRTECINNEIKCNIVSKQQDFGLQNSLTQTNTPLLGQKSKPLLHNLSKLKLQDKQNSFKNSISLELGLKVQNSPKNEYQKAMSQATTRVNDLLNGVITRKNDKMCQQEQQVGLYTKNVKGKHKIQKYKEEYRNFLKNQLFQNIKIN